MADIFSALATRQNPNQAYFKKLLDEGMNTSPIGSHWQGASRLAHSLLAGYMLGQQNQDEEASRKLRMDLPGLEPSPTAAAPATSPIVGALAGRGIESGPDMSLPRGLRNNNPLNIEAGPFTQGQEGFVGSDGRFARFAEPQQGVDAASKLLDVYGSKHGLNTVRGIIGRWAPSAEAGNNTGGYVASVAARLGVDPDQPLGPEHRQALIAAMGQFENGRPIQMASGPQVVGQEGIPERPNAQGVFGPDAVMLPQQTARVDPAALPPNATPTQGYAVPGAPQGQGAAVPQRSPVQIDPAMAQRIRAMIGSRDPALQQQGYELYKQFAKPREETRPLTDPRERARYGIQPTDTNPYQVDAKGEVKPINPQPFAVNVNQQQESEFKKEAGSMAAKRFDGYVKLGNESREITADLGALRDIGARITTGKTAEVTAALGPYAEALGVPIKDLPDLQAYNAIVSKMQPRMRVPGSGATSDYEMQTFLKAIPSLGKTPEGNTIVTNTMDALHQHRVTVADIASQALSGEITQTEAEKKIRTLPDPMEQWKKSKGSLPSARTDTAPSVDDLLKKYGPK